MRVLGVKEVLSISKSEHTTKIEQDFLDIQFVSRLHEKLYIYEHFFLGGGGRLSLTPSKTKTQKREVGNNVSAMIRTESLPGMTSYRVAPDTRWSDNPVLFM